MAEVVLENVTKTYPGGVTAVDQVNLAVGDGELVALVGPSGCGKSTTLRMIAGLEDVTAGTLRIGPRVVNNLAPKDRDIAMVFQNYALYPHLTVRRNMAFGLMLRRRYGGWGNPLAALLAPARFRAARQERREIDARVRSAAALLGLEELLDRRPQTLSGGQRQRVAVGRAIVRNPQAFLLDEPLSNLDARLRVELRTELKALHRKLQTTTIYVTHDQEEALTLGDRVVVMYAGRVQQCGAPLEIYTAPANRFVAGFVGMPPMNFLSGRLIRNGGGLVFSSGDNHLKLCPAHQRIMAGHAGQPVVLGVRPQAIRPGPARSLGVDQGIPSGDGVLHAEVSALEPLGERVNVYTRTRRQDQIVCRIDSGTRLIEGQPLVLCLDMERVHFFASDPLGRNLSRGGSTDASRSR